jgi:hypothetical protein
MRIWCPVETELNRPLNWPRREHGKQVVLLSELTMALSLAASIPLEVVAYENSQSSLSRMFRSSGMFVWHRVSVYNTSLCMHVSTLIPICHYTYAYWGDDEPLSFGMFHLQDYSRILMNVLRGYTLNSYAFSILVCISPPRNLPS